MGVDKYPPLWYNDYSEKGDYQKWKPKLEKHTKKSFTTTSE